MASLPPIFFDVPRNPVLAVGIPVVLGLGTGFLTRNSHYGPRSVWYQSLQKATYNPPNYAFGIVWPALYASMGYASHLTIKALDRTPPGLGRDTAKLAVGLYWAQLALNQLWTPLLFGAGNITAALVDVVALTGTVVYWNRTLTKVDTTASQLVLPYVAWLAYATYLNASLLFKNKSEQPKFLKRN